MLPPGEAAQVQSHPVELVALVITFWRLKQARGEWWGRTPLVYRRHLSSFLASLPPSARLDGRKVKPEHIEAWAFRDPSHSPSYQRVQLVPVRGFFKWLTVTGKIPKDPCAGVPSPEVPEALPRAFAREDHQLLLATAERDPRDLLAVSLAFNDAHRRAEIALANVEDIDFRLGVIAVHGKGYRGKVSRRVPYSATTKRALTLYLASDPHSSGPLVRNRVTGGRLSAARVGEIIGDVIRDAGLKLHPGDGRSSHAGRHTVATELVEADVPDRIGMKFMGHKSHANWQRYHNGAVLDLMVVHDVRGEGTPTTA